MPLFCFAFSFRVFFFTFVASGILLSEIIPLLIVSEIALEIILIILM